MAGEEEPFYGKRERPIIDLRSNAKFEDMVGKEFGYTPKRSRLSEMMIGAITEHVYDAEFKSMFDLHDPDDFV